MEIQMWREILAPYDLAVQELVLKFSSLVRESREAGKYSYIERVDGRRKELSSILDKAKRKGVPIEQVTE